MAGHIVFAGMNINNIINEINVNKPQNHNTSSYVGADGSTTSYVSSEGRTLTFKSICTSEEECPHGRGHRLND